MGEIVRLPLPHGSYRYLNIRLWYVQGQGWSIFESHMHEGEKDVCEGHAEYEGLAVDELVDVVAAMACNANERFLLDAEGCHVQTRLEL